MTKKKLHIYYFSTALSDEIYDQIVLESRRFKPTFSGVGFDRNVAVGLSEQIEITGVSLYPIPSYPKYTKLRKESASYTCDKFFCKVPAMLSLPIIKEYNSGKSLRSIGNTFKVDKQTIKDLLIRNNITLRTTRSYKLSQTDRISIIEDVKSGIDRKLIMEKWSISKSYLSQLINGYRRI